MYVIKLPDGTLRVPHSVLLEPAEDVGEAGGAEGDAENGSAGGATGGAEGGATGGLIADAYVEIGPGDPDYDRLLPEALTEQELEERRRAWRDGDAELQRRFEEWKAEQPDVELDPDAGQAGPGPA
ncbi:hypothetical protein [Actinomadura hibisca]|uniref:hypothetical protein n=1 Tax=Actinomadura hibisca TaxID=68565 RepID=UPI0008300721|nr:hypothetical protein [Actinomadura hibisca]